MSDKSVKALSPAPKTAVLQSVGKKTAHNAAQFHECSVVPETKHVPASGHDGSDVEEETVHLNFSNYFGNESKLDDRENSSSSSVTIGKSPIHSADAFDTKDFRRLGSKDSILYPDPSLLRREDSLIGSREWTEISSRRRTDTSNRRSTDSSQSTSSLTRATTSVAMSQERHIPPTSITIKARNELTPINWAVIGALVGVAVLGTAGTLLVPVIGSAVGAYAGAYGGAVVGGLLGGLLGGGAGFKFGDHKMIKDSHEGHIKAALQWFQDKGHRFMDEERWNLANTGSPTQWWDLLHVPAEHSWSSKGVAKKEDRQLIRAALIMAVAKTNGEAWRRLEAAQQIKARLLSTPEKGGRGYSVLDPDDHHSFEPARVWSAVEAFRMEDKLKKIGNELGDADHEFAADYRELVDEGMLKPHERARLYWTYPQHLKQLFVHVDRISKEDSGKIRKALLLCAATEGYTNANILKEKLCEAVSESAPGKSGRPRALMRLPDASFGPRVRNYLSQPAFTSPELRGLVESWGGSSPRLRSGKNPSPNAQEPSLKT
ncbi:hypothetical protein [Pelagibius sp.]|uniref:hypothetical protein n=1 Tax=Pelagibius sp. TaxID=1931238 RepID=UPI00262442C2|nr:hypothetical protein [Pelagibius sp.]